MTTVMVTGASGGLGAAIAKRFAGRGHHLIVVARRESQLKELQSELIAEGAASADYRVADLADAKQVQALAEKHYGL